VPFCGGAVKVYQLISYWQEKILMKKIVSGLPL